MALLLRKILKVLLQQCGEHLISLYHIASPPCGFEAAQRMAMQLKDGFQAFLQHYFIQETAGSGGLASRQDRRPATALGSAGDKSIAASNLYKRKDPADLGLWRASVRCSLEHAEHCRLMCAYTTGLLSLSASLTTALPLLRTTCPRLTMQAETFMKLHSGLKDGGDVMPLLDLKNQADARVKVHDVEEQLMNLLDSAKDAGVDIDEAEALAGDIGQRRVLPSEQGMSEVLTLSCDVSANRPATSGELQENISLMQEELQKFGEQLEHFGDTIKENSRPPTGMCFNPPPRVRAQGGKEERRDSATAIEVAKRSAWYCEPPPVLPMDVPMIEVHSRIQQTPIHRCPSRPRTAQPRLFATLTAEQSPRNAAGSSSDANAGSPETSAETTEPSKEFPVDASLEIPAADPVVAVSAEVPEPEPTLSRVHPQGVHLSCEGGNEVVEVQADSNCDEPNDEEEESFDPFGLSPTTFRIA